MSQLQVLLIDSDEAEARLVQMALDAHAGGFELTITTTLEQAMERLGRGRYDVVLLDLTLPDSSGLASVAAISEEFPEVPLVVLTGFADDQLSCQALDHGAQDFLFKGEVTLAQLDRALRHAVQRHRIQLENQRLVARLEHLADHDSLTGLLNRRAFNTELERAWTKSVQSGSPLACVMLDVDFFKRINDTYGHFAGDCILQRTAAVLRENCDGCFTAARVGGEEFCILLPDTDEDRAHRWAESVREHLARESVQVDADYLRITGSFGVAERLSDDGPAHELVTHADEALRVAKHMGRNQAVSFGQVQPVSRSSTGEVNDVFGTTRAEDVMVPFLFLLQETHSYQQAVDLLLGTRLESLPIVNCEGKLSGLVTDEDLIARLLTEDAWQSTLAESVHRKTACFCRDVPVSEISEFLRRSAVRRIVVVDEDDKPVGMISGGTILRWMKNARGRPQRSRTLADSVFSVPSTLRRITGALECLEQEVHSLQSEITDKATDPATSLIGGATRIQALLDESLSHVHRSQH